MKLCFVLQRRFAYIGHNIALLLKEKYGLDDFCAYVSQRSSYDFLKSQKEIDYSKILLEENIHKEFENEKLDLDYLRQIEKEYGIPNLWPYLTIDRVVMSNQLVREYPYDNSPYNFDEMLRILQVKIKAIINFLEKEKPDFVFISIIGSTGVSLLYHIAKKKNIKVWLVLPTMIKNKYTWSEHYAYFTEAEKRKTEPTKERPVSYMEEAKKYIQNFRQQPTPYYKETSPKNQPVFRSQQMKFLLPRNLLKTLLWTIKYFYRHYTSSDRHDYSYIGPFNYLKDGAKRKLRNLIGNNDLYDHYDPTDDFAFFPLHYEPEIGLLLQAPFFVNQLHTIKQIAYALPVGHKLYVKEHPVMMAYRPRSFYKQLKKIPNLKLIHPSVTSYQIIPHAKLILTITGTVGWESLIFKKPIILFGEIFYNKLSFVTKCPKIEDLPQRIKDLMENPRYDEDELLRYIAFILEDSADINLQYLWEREPDMAKKKKGIEPLVDLLAKKIGIAR